MKRKSVWQERVPAAMFAFFLIFGYGFAKTDSWDYILGSVKNLAVSAVLGMLLYLVLLRGICILFDFVNRVSSKDKFSEVCKNKWLSWIMDEHPAIGSMLILVIAWAPYVLAQYPAGMSHDAYSQLNQALKYTEMTSHHPPFHSHWIGICVRVGRKLGSMDLGIFLYVLTQLVLVIGVLGYFMWYLREKQINKKLRLVLLCLFAFFPLFPVYATTVIKDVPYIFCMMMYVMLMLQILETFQNDGKYLWRYLVLQGIFGLLLMLLRNNGIYAVIPSAVGLLCAGKHLWKKYRRMCMTTVILLFLPVVIFEGYEGWFLPSQGIKPGSVRMVLSIPFQQTARYVIDYGDEVTEEEKEIINKVLDYSSLAEIYNPNLSDPLTWQERSEEIEDLMAYFKVWFRHFLNHPAVYVEATMNNVYPLFYPGVDNTVIFFSLLHEYGYTNFQQPEMLREYREGMASFTEQVLKFPGINLLNNMALWVWVFFLQFFYCWKERKWDGICGGIPALTTVLVCIAGPAILGHPRYVYPVMISVLVLLVPCLTENR